MGIIILAVLLGYVVLSIVLAIGVHYLGKKKGWRWCNWWVVLIIMILILTWDIPSNRIYFNYLCSTEAGMNVYETVDLSSLSDEYYLKHGESNLKYSIDSPFAKHVYTRHGVISIEKIENIYSIGTQYKHIKGFEKSMLQRKTIIQDLRSMKTIGEAISFSYFGGWFYRFVSLDGGTSIYCPSNAKPDLVGNIHNEIIDKTFK